MGEQRKVAHKADLIYHWARQIPPSGGGYEMNTITRRAFITRAAKATVALSAGGCGFLFKGCASKKDFDVVITGGTVYDGRGGVPYQADIGILGDRIETVGKIPLSRAARIVDARGLAVSPGFIDAHDHTAEGLLVNPRAESAVRQGVTTLVSGNCGESPFPLSAEMAEELRKDLMTEYGLELSWRDIRGFFDRLEKTGTAVNYSSLVGQGTLRASVVGYRNRPPSPEELEAMVSLVTESMRGGALGLSTGLEYSPGSFADTEEILELAGAAARFGGVYATHMRDEEDRVLEALEEAFRIARMTPIKLQISHVKIGYASNWPLFGSLLEKIDAARTEGLDFRCDRYPYTAWATGLNLFFPLWSREGPARDFVARLKDPSLQNKLRGEIALKETALHTWADVLISSVSSEKNRHLEGKNIQEASREAGLDPYEFMRRLLIEEEGRVGSITFGMSEDHLKTLYSHPLVGVGADGSAVAPYGKLARGKPHPRLFGTFPRVLGKYVREESVVPLEEMIRKMTSMPASHFGMYRRGMIEKDWAADIVVFDPDRVIDRATWTNPQRYPDGIPYVMVNGRFVVDEGEHSGILAGRVLKKVESGQVS